MALTEEKLKGLAAKLAEAMPISASGGDDVTLTRKGASVVRDALLLGLVTIGASLRAGATLERGDEVFTIARALQCLERRDGGEPVW